MTAWISPASHSRLTPWSTSTPRKLFRMSFIANSGAIAYGTSTHAPAAAEASTASIRCALRAPSANVGSPSGASPPRMAEYESATKRSKQSR